MFKFNSSGPHHIYPSSLTCVTCRLCVAHGAIAEVRSSWTSSSRPSASTSSSSSSRRSPCGHQVEFQRRSALRVRVHGVPLYLAIAIACRHPRLASALVMPSSMALPVERPARGAMAISSIMVHLRPSLPPLSPSLHPLPVVLHARRVCRLDRHAFFRSSLCLAFFFPGRLCVPAAGPIIGSRSADWFQII